MKTQNIIIATFMFSFFLSSTAFSQQGNKQDDSLSAGSGIIYRTSVYKGVDDNVFVIPYIYYNKGSFSFKGRSIHYKFYDKDNLSFELIGLWDFRGYDDDDSFYLNGMHDREMTLEGGIGASYDDGWGMTSFTFVNDMLGRHHGQELTLSYSKAFNIDKLRLIPSVGISYLSNDLANYYYGVRSSEATAVRRRYSPDSAWNPYGALNAAYQINEKWSFIGSIKMDFFDKEIHNSPLVDKNYQLQLSAGILYRF